MKPYENCKIHGPYTRKDGRQHVVIVYPDKKKKTVSYAKYLLETNNGEYLSENDTVHHKDKNPLNNSMDNLEIISRGDHVRQHTIKYKEDIVRKCTCCGKDVVCTARQQKRRHSNRFRDKGGIFCNKTCSGKYGSDICKVNKLKK
jgi:hypothetical protein